MGCNGVFERGRVDMTSAKQRREVEDLVEKPKCVEYEEFVAVVMVRECLLTRK